MTSPALRLEPTDDAALWDQLVREHDGSVAFHSSAFLDFQQDLLDVRIERLVVVADGAPVGVLPLPRCVGRSFAAPALPFPYIGPLVPAELLTPTLTTLRRRQLRAGPALARLDIPPDDVRPETGDVLRAAGTPVHDDSTVVVDISHGSAETLTSRFTKVRRKQLRKAKSAGAEARTARPGDFAALMPQLLHEAYGVRGGPSPYPRSIGARFEAWVADHPEHETLVVTIDGERAGAVTVLGGRPTAVMWIGGALRRFRDTNANAFVHQAVLEWAVGRGHTSVDLSGWVDDGVGAFKLGFGGERRPYLTVRSIVGPPIMHDGLRRLKRRIAR